MAATDRQAKRKKSKYRRLFQCPKFGLSRPGVWFVGSIEFMTFLTVISNVQSPSIVLYKRVLTKYSYSYEISG